MGQGGKYQTQEEIFPPSSGKQNGKEIWYWWFFSLNHKLGKRKLLENFSPACTEGKLLRGDPFWGGEGVKNYCLLSPAFDESIEPVYSCTVSRKVCLEFCYIWNIREKFQNHGTGWTGECVSS